MIVIATNNGWDYIDINIEKIKEYDINKKENVIIVDTNSSDISYTEYIENKCKKENILFDKLNYSGYDFGAYKFAYEKYKDTEEFFIFQHDSVVINNIDSYQFLKNNSSNSSVCAWMSFHKNVCEFDNNSQREWCKSIFNTYDYDYGVYGPNFCIRTDMLSTLYSQINNAIVDNKIKQQGMERGWAILFKKNNIHLNYLEQMTGIINSDKYFTKLKHKKGECRS